METIQMLGSLGEFVGAIAVVTTLIFLVFQVRANTHSLDESRRLALSQAYQARAEVQQDAFMRSMDSPYLADISLKLQSDGLQAMTQEERWRWTQYQLATFIRLDNVHFQYEQGFIEEDFWEALSSVVNNAGRAWEELELGNYRPGFHKEVQRILAEAEAQS